MPQVTGNLFIISAKQVLIYWALYLLNVIKMQVGSLQRQVAFFIYKATLNKL